MRARYFTNNSLFDVYKFTKLNRILLNFILKLLNQYYNYQAVFTVYGHLNSLKISSSASLAIVITPLTLLRELKCKAIGIWYIEEEDILKKDVQSRIQFILF